MAEFYRFKIGLNPGSGTITVNGVAPELYYLEGTTLNIAVTLDSGWNSIEWFSAGVSLSTSTSFSVIMPSRDYSIRGVASGDFQPVDGYGLLYFSEVPDMYDSALLRLEIYKDGFGGVATEVKCKDLFINFGDVGANSLLTQTVIGTSFDFTLAGEPGDYDEFLTGDLLTYAVVLKRNGNIVFDGFLNPDFIEHDDISGPLLFSFTAIDGIKAFESFRVNPFIFPGGISGVRDKALNAIIGSLNQIFVEPKNVNFICNVHEDRMDNSQLVFSQFFWPEGSVFTDGERQKFENGTVIWNENVSIKEAVESLTRPFLCRVFIWDNQFWVIRIPDMVATSMIAQKYLPSSEFDSSLIIDNDLDLSCQVSPKPRFRTGRIYTEFTAVLKLGVLEFSARSAAFEASFGADNWFVGSPASAYPGRFILSLWDYINARPSNQPSSVPTGDLALVQFASDLGSEACKIWTTTTTAGLSDPNLSAIMLTTEDTGVGFIIADEVANKLSVDLEFMVLPIGSSVSNTINNHSVAIQVKIDNYYLRESATPNVYEFTTTVANCIFPVPNIGTFNKIKITNVPILNTGFVEVKLYQLILNSGTRHQFAISYKNFKLSIEENDALVKAELSAKGITERAYTSVFPDYEINIGDAKTNMSTSAIKLDLAGTPVSESWSDPLYTSFPLNRLIVQNIADLYGRSNRILSGTVYNVNLKPYQSFLYDGTYWIVLNMRWNIHRNSYDFQAFELGLIQTT